MSKEKQTIEEMALTICKGRHACYAGHCRKCDQHENRCLYQDIACLLYKEDYRRQSEVIDEFAKRLKEAPIKCGLPLLGLSTKGEIEEYFNGIMLQVRDAIDGIAREMKGGAG